jgi:general secretion pathway protein H
MSRAGESRWSGFTLVELLVVLAVLGLALALVAPVGRSPWSGVAARSGAETVAAALREARSEAIARNREAVLLVDLDAHELRLDGGPPVSLDHDLALALVTGTEEVLGAGAGQIRFFPDGTSTGGRVTVAAGKKRLDVLVDWITGRVRVVE